MSRLLRSPHPLTRMLAVTVGVVFLAGLALLTLTPVPLEDRMPNLLDQLLTALRDLGWAGLRFTQLELLANVAVFVPVGILAFLLLPRRVWVLSVLVGPALSIAIESAQAALLPHRAATVSDVIANSAGATLGVLVAVLCTLVFTPRRPSQHPSPTLEAS